jgi:hypothetical protein
VTTGILCNGDDLNGSTAVACQWQESNSTVFNAAANRAVDFTNLDGFSFLGCSSGRTALEFTDCERIQFNGGYYEYPEAPVIIAVNSSLHFDGVFFPSGTQVNLDDASYRLSGGSTVPCTTNRFHPPAPALVGAPNIFPNPECNTPSCFAGFTGTMEWTRSINGSNNLQLDVAAVTKSAQIKLPDTTAGGISVYVKLKVVSGEVSVRLLNCTTTSPTTLTASADWQYIRLWSHATPGTDQPYLQIKSSDVGGAGITAWQIEIDEICVVPAWGAICDPDKLARDAGPMLGLQAEVKGAGYAIAASGTVSIPMFEFNGLLAITAEDASNSNNKFTKALFHIVKQGSNKFSAVSISSVDGSTSAQTFTVTDGTPITVVLTNTESADVTNFSWSAVGIPK